MFILNLIYSIMKNLFVLLSCICCFSCKPSIQQIDLSGTWEFTTDTSQWNQSLILPGSVTSNRLGEDISMSTPWTGTIVDSSFFFADKYAKYRTTENFKVPFWLQPEKYFRGEAWYKKTVEIPQNWDKYDVMLTLERCHWDTELWIDGSYAGSGHSLGTPHRYLLTQWLTPGKHELLLKVDNSLKTVNPGINSHSVTDHTQGNWNGVIGKIALEALPQIRINHLDIFPDIDHKKVKVELEALNSTSTAQEVTFKMEVGGRAFEKSQTLPTGTSPVYAEIEMGDSILLWDEFHPHLYQLNVHLSGTDGKELSHCSEQFGMRKLEVVQNHILINGRKVFFRGMLDCAAFPLTGYPSMDKEYWVKMFTNCRNHGLNHVRFHSWCPPEIAFQVADEMGFYLQIECSSWANQGITIGDGTSLDQFIRDESERMVREYGNHPSFCMMLYGNEPSGEKSTPYLADFVTHWKEKDTRRLYSTAAGWPNLPINDFLNDPTPRIQGWGQGLTSIINAEAPRTNYDWSNYVQQFNQPVISHEIGQWCVYPDFKEISKYTGLMKAHNFEIFRDDLKKNGMIHLADSFLLASGKLQALCYKADIEAALRTPDFGGFQLLGLYDFPGQGTALVGVLNVFGEEKGYISPEEYRQFSNTTVPLARLPKLIYTNNESLTVSVEVAHFGDKQLSNPKLGWILSTDDGKTIGKGQWNANQISIGNNIPLGNISFPLSGITEPKQLSLKVYVNDFENEWHIWVYPSTPRNQYADNDILVTNSLDNKAKEVLEKGGKVLLSLPKGKLRADMGGDIQIGFSSIFWNTAWTLGQAPHTLGILCNPHHPALSQFPTNYYSDYQWWDAMSYSNAIEMDKLAKGAQPIVRVIDDWFTNRSLGLITEFKVGKGKLVLSGIDFWQKMDERPAARQLLNSLKAYMSSEQFHPVQEIKTEDLQQLY